MITQPPAFQLYAKDALEGCAEMSLTEFGLYWRLLFLSWGKGALPRDPVRLARMAGCTPEEFSACWPAVRIKWIDDGEGLTNARLESEREKQRAYRELQAEKGRQGGRPRKPQESRGKPVAFPGLKPEQSPEKAGTKAGGKPEESSSSSSSSSLSDLRSSPSVSDENGDRKLSVNGKSDGHGKGARAVSDPKWTNGQGRHYGSSLVGNHVRCFHAPAACARGLCVPQFLGLQWTQQLRDSLGDIYGDDLPERTVQDFVAAALGVLPPGPIGDDPIKFWRAAWSARHGSQAPAPSEPARSTKASRTKAAFEQIAREEAARKA